MFFASLNKTNDHIINENSEIFWFSVQIKKDKTGNVIFKFFYKLELTSVKLLIKTNGLFAYFKICTHVYLVNILVFYICLINK